MSDNYIARYWKAIEEGNIECYLCPRHCKLSEGQRGACFGRQNLGGKLVLTSYGRTSGFAIDPIEKKPLNHFLPGSSVVSFGTVGCNLFCKFCQNWSLSKSKESSQLHAEASPEDIAELANVYGASSVAFTYNEPAIFLEYAVDTAKECHKKGIKTVAVTAGYIEGEAREEFFSVMDAANVDLKAFSNDFYKKYCSVKLNPVLETLKYARNNTDTWLEITNLIIPGANDSVDEIDAMTKWIVDELGADTPLHFSAFRPTWGMGEVEPTSLDTLLIARDIAMKNGMNYVYTGNVRNPESEATYCNVCGNALMDREGFNTTVNDLAIENGEAKCGKCGAKCAGVY
ncbi:MAG: AmmeMemoRadiSam system radical SAM enzyme [Alphaproteobacteria bacterium]|nr:AmmeMemoRadiSam system radical SAM enzyme [Alphaproteobacteria bacterium]